MADAQSPQGQTPEGQPEVRAEDPHQTEEEGKDAGHAEGTAKPPEAAPQGEPQRDIGRTTAGVIAIVIAAGCFVWLILDQSLPLWAIAAITLLAASAAGAAAWLLVPRTIDPRLKRAIEVGVTIIAIIVGLLAIQRTGSDTKPPVPTNQSPSSSTASSPAPPSASPSPTPAPTEVLFDDFNGKAIDPNKWARDRVYDSDPKQLPKQIYIKDGKLHLEVSPENSPTVANAELKARFPSGWTITKISVKMTLEHQQGKSDGAAYLSISSFDDRETRAWMGPGGANQDIPMLGYTSCKEFDTDCTIINQREIPIGQEYQIEAFANQKDSKSKRHLDFQVTGEAWGAYAKSDAGEIRSFRFYLFSEAKRDFRVTVDEVRITYI